VLFQMKKDELCAVSTDGHRLVKLSQRKSPLKNGEKDIVIPGKALSIIVKSSDESAFTVFLNDSRVMPPCSGQRITAGYFPIIDDSQSTRPPLTRKTFSLLMPSYLT